MGMSHDRVSETTAVAADDNRASQFTKHYKGKTTEEQPASGGSRDRVHGIRIRNGVTDTTDIPVVTGQVMRHGLLY